MRPAYHQIEPDNWLEQAVTRNPKLPSGVSFLKGAFIADQIQEPLSFEVDFPSRDAVPHFIGNTIPVFSNELVKGLAGAGVSNYQVFAAKLHSTITGEDWDGFWAFNVLGLVRAADRTRSEADTLMEEDPDGSKPPLLAFNRLVLDSTKTGNQLMFRLAESPVVLLIHESVLSHLVDNPPPGRWRFDATRIETS